MDLDLVRRLERLEAAVWADAVAGAPPATREALGLSVTPMAGGVALRATALRTLLFNRAFAFGLDGPLGASDLEAIAAHYPRDRPFTIQPCAACAWPGASEWLTNHDMPSWFVWVCWQRALDGAPPAAPDPARTLVRATADDAERFAATATSVFGMPDTAPWLAALVGRAGWHHYLALEGGAAAGVGVTFVKDDLAWLGWGGTLPAHRGRGIQAALLARRLADARALGVTRARVETSDDKPERPNPSFRNVRRAGFEILHRRPSHAHVPPGDRIADL